jgi:hypothetical protein
LGDPAKAPSQFGIVDGAGLATEFIEVTPFLRKVGLIQGPCPSTGLTDNMHDLAARRVHTHYISESGAVVMVMRARLCLSRIVASCKWCGVEPFAWFRDVLFGFRRTLSPG